MIALSQPSIILLTMKLQTSDWESALSKEIQISYQLANQEYRESEGQNKNLPIKRRYEVILNVLHCFSILGLENRKKWDNADSTLDLVKVFNPITLTWENPKFLFSACLAAVDVLYVPSDVIKLSSFIFETLRNSKAVMEVPKPYSGSRYLLFNNGIFDCLTQEIIDVQAQLQLTENDIEIPMVSPNATLEIEDHKVPIANAGFTEKHRHYIDLDLNMEVPKYQGKGNNETWDPQTWLLKTAGGRANVAHYILEIIGIMLVPNHSFNAFIEINGKSGSGKTVITNIAKGIYGDNEVAIPEDFTIDQAMDNFPFRGLVNQDTALVHITEVNGTYLNPTMISLFNSFANPSMEMKQMGNVSVKLTPPPVLVMEGVSWAKFDNTKTGIARRLLPLDLSESNTMNYRSSHSKDIFRFKKVLKWFAKEAVLALSELTQGDDHFAFNIDDVDTLPDFARRWHMMAINAGDDLMNTFMLKIKDSLHNGFLPMKMMFRLYAKSVLDDDPEQKHSRKFPSFRDALRMYLSEDFMVIRSDELQHHDEEELGIDLKQLSHAMALPKELENYQTTDYAKYKQAYWLEIKRKAAF